MQHPTLGLVLVLIYMAGAAVSAMFFSARLDTVIGRFPAIPEVKRVTALFLVTLAAVWPIAFLLTRWARDAEAAIASTDQESIDFTESDLPIGTIEPNALVVECTRCGEDVHLGREGHLNLMRVVNPGDGASVEFMTLCTECEERLGFSVVRGKPL